jgi:uncharacterized membrane protein
MTEVVFLTSNQGHQVERVRSIAQRLRQRLPDVTVTVLDTTARPELLTKHKVKFGPAVVVDGLLEYVGIPRFSMLVDRILQVRERRPSPRTAGDKPGEKPAALAAPTSPPRPATPPPPPATGSA